MEYMNDDIKGLIMPLAIVLVLVAALIGGIVFLFTYDSESGLNLEEEYKAEEDKENTYSLNDNQMIKTNMKALFKTNLGDIEIQLAGKDAPKTVANFVKLANEGFYNGTRFHRVIKGFMIQGGDPLSKDNSAKDRWGTGGPGYTFEDEIHMNNHNVIGTISMANAGPNTNGSQFFINTADNDFLDPKHTVFGQVINGMEVVRKIEGSEVNSSDQPIVPIILESVTIIEE